MVYGQFVDHDITHVPVQTRRGGQFIIKVQIFSFKIFLFFKIIFFVILIIKTNNKDVFKTLKLSCFSQLIYILNTLKDSSKKLFHNSTLLFMIKNYNYLLNLLNFVNLKHNMLILFLNLL